MGSQTNELNESLDLNVLETKQARLVELCQLLSMQDAPVTEWFKTLSESQADVDPFTAVEFQDMNERTRLDSALLPQIFTVLHECILNLRWMEVLKVLHFIIRVPVGSSHTCWKVGFELIQREENERLISKLFDQMKCLSDLECKDVVLEYALYLMSRGESEAALDKIQETVVRQGQKREKKAKDYYVDKLTRGYTGLLWYIQWKNLQAKLKQDIEETENQSQGFMMPHSSQAQTIEMKMNNCADKAILCFGELVGQPGVWDIFVDKHVELLMVQQKTHDALTVLQKSVELNPENPNAQKYLYRFYAKHFADSDNVIKQLKVIADLVPSDSLVIELCKKLQTDDMGLACSYLFQLLDYSCWQNVPAPWKMMSTFLSHVFQSVPEEESDMQTVMECWKVRSSWWPVYHFTDHYLGQASDESLVFHKAVVAGLLLGSDDKFTNRAKTFLTSPMRKRLKKTLKKI